MIKARTQTPEYWEKGFHLTDSDVEQLYNHFIETEKPQTIEQLTAVLINHRVNEEVRKIEHTIKGHQMYQPQNNYEVGDKLVFPALDFVQGTVTGLRQGFNPQEGDFQVIAVEIGGRMREFVAAYMKPHVLSSDDGQDLIEMLNLDKELLYKTYGKTLGEKLGQSLTEHSEFIELGSQWFVKSLMAEINVGHLHLSEAVLEINEGGPMAVEEILPNLDLDTGIDPAVQKFSLNYALKNDGRFDDVGGRGKVAWFLRRLEPEEVQQIPGRLVYRPIDYDRSSLSPQLRSLERELDDEWSRLEPVQKSQPAILALTYPHRWAGTLPLSSRLKPLFDTGSSPQQRVVLIDEETEENIVGWVVPEGSYVFGLGDWYNKNKIPVGGFIHLAPTDQQGVLTLGYEIRRPKREWVRLATSQDNRIHFELERRSIGCGYDDLLIVGTDVVAAIDALWRRADANQRSIVSLLIELFPTLAALTPQKAVHAKTLYSALNMLRRTPPGPIFAELVNNPAFQTVGDHYWTFDESRLHGGR
ncbi:MAG: hypothetical protein ACK2T4_00445 [Candidatus Promineifilaceae bacterium]